MNYFELKRQKAKEQGKTHWFEAILTDQEANLRTSEEEWHNCLSCRYLRDTARHLTDTCLQGHHITNYTKQICDEWRYFA